MDPQNQNVSAITAELSEESVDFTISYIFNTKEMLPYKCQFQVDSNSY